MLIGMCTAMAHYQMKYHLTVWKKGRGFGCNGIPCQTGEAQAFPDGTKEGHLSDDEGDGGEERGRTKMLKKKKKKVKLLS